MSCAWWGLPKKLTNFWEVRLKSEKLVWSGRGFADGIKKNFKSNGKYLLQRIIFEVCVGRLIDSTDIMCCFASAKGS